MDASIKIPKGLLDKERKREYKALYFLVEEATSENEKGRDDLNTKHSLSSYAPSFI